MDFDTAKENIQPLRGGRNVHTLETALHAENDVETQQKLAETRRQFEEAIISQSQDEDPLEPWCEYIMWLEQSYPKSGKESTLHEVLIKCIEQFQQDKRYRQDRRMIKLYIKFIDGKSDPQDYFMDLYNNGIGTMVSDLYIAWAYYYDIVENFKQAETVFRKGLDAGAQPYDELVQAHKNFNFSVSQRMFYNDESSKEQWKSSMAEQRNALTSLRAHKKRYVGSQRTGGVVKSHLPGIVNQENRSGNVVAPSASNASIQVYDESQGGDRVDVTIGGNRTMQRSIVDTARMRENVHEPGPWTNLTKNEKKKGRLFESKPRSTLGFSIAEDDDDDNAPPQSQNIPVLVENFSRGIQLPKGFVRKNQPQSELKVATMIVDPGEKASGRVLALPMYNKSFLYPKPELEFSPEELRAYYWFKRHSIENEKTKAYVTVWANSYECGIRLPYDFVAKNQPQTDQIRMTPFVPDETLKFAINISNYYPSDGGEEMSYDELMAQQRWATGKIKRYESQEEIEMEDVDGMDETNIGPRRMSVYPLRLTTNNRRTTVLPPTFEGPTKVAESEAEFEAPIAIEKFEIFQDTSQDPAPSTGAIRKSVFSKRRSSYMASQSEEDPLKRKCIVTTPVRIKTRLDLENSDDLKMPPPMVPLTKTPAFSEPIEASAPEPKFEIFQDEPDPPAAKSRPTNQYFNPNDSCSTQTFNFFIKSQSVSTPKASKAHKSALATVEDQHILQQIPNKTSICSPPEHDNPEQEYQTPPLTVNTLANKQLSTIMETTETNTMSSAVTTKSSVDQGSSPEEYQESHQQNKTHQTTKFTNISEKIRSDLSVLHKDVSCEDKSKSSKLFKPPHDQSERHTTVSSSILPPASFRIFEDRTETVPVIPSFKLMEDRTENAPVAPSFRLVDDRTETLPEMPSLKITGERIETLPVMPSFQVSEDATQTFPKMPPQMAFTVFEDHTETVPLMPIVSSSSVVPVANASALPTLSPARSFRIFEDTDAQRKLTSAARESNIVEPKRVLTPDPADMLDLFAKTPEKPGKSSAFDFFVPPMPNMPQTPKKSLIHQKDYVLFKPKVAETPSVDKELSLSFSDFQSDEKIVVPDSLVADKSAKNQSNHFSKMPASQNDVSLVNKSIAAKSSVSRMFSTSRTGGKLFEPALSKSITSQSFLSTTPLHSDVSGQQMKSKDTTTQPVSYNKFSFAQPSAAASPPLLLRNAPSAKEISPATFASALEDDCINTERFCLNLPNIQNSTLLPERLTATSETVERTLSRISISASTELAVTEKTVINVEQSKANQENVCDLSCSLDEAEIQMLVGGDSKIKPPTFREATLQPQLSVIQIDETQTDQKTVTESDAHAEALGVSIYVPRQRSAEKMLNYDDQWEEIDETFVPGMDYNHAAVDLDQTKMVIQELKGRHTINPFDKKLCGAMLEEIEFKKYIEDNLSSCVMLNLIAPLKKGVLVDCRTRQFEISKLIGSGGYGTVFSAKCTETDEMFAVKQERPCNLWEFYVCLELQSRLSNINPNILKAFMNVEYSIIAHNASILISELSPYGNILDVCNTVRGATNKNLDEYIVMMITSQILLIIDHLHACNIIHADIKPDNFLVMRRLEYGSKNIAIQLIDFGVAIDMNMFEENTTFKYTTSKPDTFTCIEMRESKPWTYQTDLFGVAGSAHVMLFGKYMEVEKKMVNWHIKSKLPRYFNKSVWDNFFTTLLNVRGCREMPNLQTVRYSLDEAIVQKEKYVKEKVADFNKCLS